jgi:hypothetical protein
MNFNDIESRFPYIGVSTFFGYPNSKDLNKTDVAMVGVPLIMELLTDQELVSVHDQFVLLHRTMEFIYIINLVRLILNFSVTYLVGLILWTMVMFPSFQPIQKQT